MSDIPRRSELRLLPIAGDDQAGLLAELERLARELDAGVPLADIARRRLIEFREHRNAPYTLVLVAPARAELLQEVQFAYAGVIEAFDQGSDWETPLGSYFTPRPFAGHGQVAFVYPGAFSSYPGMGRELFQLFPGLHERLAELVSDTGRAVGDQLLYPRARLAPSELDTAAPRTRLHGDAVTMIESGTTAAVLLTTIMREYFSVRPAAAFGYSMGEAAMMWAMGVWRSGDEASRRLRASPLFKTRLVGTCDAAREYLGLSASGPNDFWSTYICKVPAAAVRERLRQERQVFLTHVNAPAEVVISGATEEVQRVVAALCCDSFRAPVTSVIHCEAMRSEYDALLALHRLDSDNRGDTRFYSAADYAPAPLDGEGIAHNIARAICQPLDFPRLVERVYDDGARIFVELGPGNSCARWIGEILKGQPHVSMSAGKRGLTDAAALMKVLARLISHGVQLDLGPLLEPEPARVAPPHGSKRSLMRAIRPGGSDLMRAIILDEHRALLAAHRRSANKPVSLPHTCDADAFRRHRAFLDERLAAFRTWAAGAPTAPPAFPPPRRSEPTGHAGAGPKGVVWDEADLVEFAGGKIARVFGPAYAAIDAYTRRVRLPLPPYLLVSRVTRLDARMSEFKPSSLTTEYDIPRQAWYTVDGQIPTAIAVESGQCDLLLISYLGIDFSCRGERVYRLLDCTLTFLDALPSEGQTLRYDIRISSFARSGETLLFFFNYRCFVGERMILRMDGGCAGFFTDDELAQGRGVVDSRADLHARRRATRRVFTPPLKSTRHAFDRDALLQLSEGDIAACFGPHYDQRGRNRSLRLPPRAILMLDRVVAVDVQGGDWGLGLLVAEHDLDPDHWYFPCHFTDDPVLAGSLMAEGCSQLLQFYLLLLGLQTYTFDACFQPMQGVPQAVRCRGQVVPTVGKLTYRMEVTDLSLSSRPYAKANVDIIHEGKIVVRFNDLSLELVEKNPHIAPPEFLIREHRRPARFDEEQIRQFTTGSVVACFGEDYAVYQGRRTPRTPNGDLQLISRVIEADGPRREPRPGSSLVSEYDVPANPWFCYQNSYPTAPYSVLMELALQPCGFLSAYLGSMLMDTERDFYFRNLDGRGHLLREIDIRGTTISNHVRLNTSTSLDGVIIQKFDYALACDGEVFYQGDATFGYFTPQTLANQTGLDRGQHTRAWIEQHGEPPAHTTGLSGDGAVLHRARADRPHERLASGQLSFLDTAMVLPAGGRYGQGYVYGSRTIDPDSWFFGCHFYQDPVMPGSLGVEAVIEALQIFVLRCNMGRTFHSPRFGQVPDHQTVWTYRGQIVPSNRAMTVEANVKHVGMRPGRLIVVADASVWRDGLRIYAITDLAIALVEAEQ